MAFNSKWSASEIFRAVKAALGKDYIGSDASVESGGARVDGEPLVLNKYICNAKNLILYPATDIQNHKPAEISIRTALSSITKNDIVVLEKLIIPVSEQQKILGRPRNHWVTLTYDFDNHTATIIDSRPRILSFLYPTKHMTTMLKEGLNQAGLDTSEFKVKHIYQNVQHNDVRCGAWTSTNILKQCDHPDYKSLDVKDMDEIGMVNEHIGRAGSIEEKTRLAEKPKGFFQWLKSFLFSSKPEQVAVAVLNEKSGLSTEKMLGTLSEGKKSSDSLPAKSNNTTIEGEGFDTSPVIDNDLGKPSKPDLSEAPEPTSQFRLW